MRAKANELQDIQLTDLNGKMSGTIRTLKSTVYNVSQNEQNVENLVSKFDNYKEAISK